LARLNVDRETLARVVREDARTDRTRFGSGNQLEKNEIGNRPLA
jgi:hypothetical protein